MADLSKRFGSRVSVRYIDLYSVEACNHPEVVPYLIRPDSSLPILRLDEEELLFGMEAVPGLIRALEEKLARRA